LERNDRAYTYHGVKRQTDRLMGDTDRVDILREQFGSPGSGLVTREDPGGVPVARFIQTHTNRLAAFRKEPPAGSAS
jgi:hypothetical protein